MQRGSGTPIRKPHTSTSDLLTWPAPEASSSANVSRPTARSNQPSDGISKVLSGGQITDAEAESLNKRKPCSGFKLKEMNGSKIFAPDSEDGSTESESSVGNFNSRTSVRIVKQAAIGVSQISFSTEENISPKKPTSLHEVAKQRELSGTIESESDSRTRKQLSNAKSKELSGIDIFGPPAEISARPSAASRATGIKENKDMSEPAPRTQRTSVKVSNPAGGQSNILFGDEPSINSSKKIHNQKLAELTGNDIFKGDVCYGSGEKLLSEAKLKEMNGNNIFADGKAESRDYFGGVRKPPGGESSIASIFQRETS